MLAIVVRAMDDGTSRLARAARVQRKDGGYHETFGVHVHMVVRVREVLDCAVFVNNRVAPV